MAGVGVLGGVLVLLLAGLAPAAAFAQSDEESEGDSSVAYFYHGIAIGHDDEVVEDVPAELLEEYLGETTEEPEPEAGEGTDDAEGEAEEADAGSEEDEIGSRGLSWPLALTPYGIGCLSQAVPLPPPLSSARWKNLGRLPPDRIFAATASTRVEVLVAKAVDDAGKLIGSCIALPRGAEDGSISALGVICQSNRTGKACFWDNLERYGTPGKLTASRYQDLDVNHFQDGSQLVENCTNCHRGDNAFVIHADTVLARDPELSTSVRMPDVTPYTPIGSSGWLNPAHASPPGNCTDCHSLPAFSREYCGTVLQPSIGKTMPPPDQDLCAFSADVEQIVRECCLLEPGSTAAECRKRAKNSAPAPCA